MAVYFKDGNWEQVPKGYAKVNGNWELVTCVHVKINGSWEAVCCGDTDEDDGDDDGGQQQQTVSPEIFWSLTQTKNANDVLDDGTRPLDVIAMPDQQADEVTITWNVFNEDLVDHYDVFRADTKDGNYTKINSSNITQKSYTDTSISEGSKKFYKVQSALTNGNTSQFSVADQALLGLVDGSFSIQESNAALKLIDAATTTYVGPGSAFVNLNWAEQSTGSPSGTKDLGGVSGANQSSYTGRLEVKYSTAPSTSATESDLPSSIDDTLEFQKVEVNQNYIVGIGNTRNHVVVFDKSANVLDFVDYGSDSSDANRDPEDIALTSDNMLYVAKRNFAGEGPGFIAYDLGTSGTLNNVFQDSIPGSDNDATFANAVSHWEEGGVTAVGVASQNADEGGEIFFYDDSISRISREAYRNDGMDSLQDLDYREADGILAVASEFSGNNPVFIIDNSFNVIDKVGSQINIVKWNNRDAKNANYLAGADSMDGSAPIFEVWDSGFNKVGEGEREQGDSQPTSLNWRKDGGVLASLRQLDASSVDEGTFVSYDSSFRFINFTQPDDAGDSQDKDGVDGAMETDGETFYVSYNSGDVSPRISSYPISDEELEFNKQYDVNVDFVAKEETYSMQTFTASTDISSPILPNPSDVTFESFSVEANQRDNEIQLSWTVSDLRVPDSYNIYRADTSNGSFSQIGSTNGTGFSDEPGIGEFFYHVRVVESGSEFNQSDTKSAELVPTNDLYVTDRKESFDSFVNHFRLTEAWNLDSSVNVFNLNLNRARSGRQLVSSEELRHPNSFAFNDDGSRIFAVRDTTSKTTAVWQISLDQAYELDTFLDDEAIFEIETELLNPSGMHFRPDGTQLFISESGAMNVYEYSLNTAYDISGSSPSFVQSVTLDDPNQSGEAIDGEIFFKPDGTRLFVKIDSGHIAEFSLSTAWDITTASFSTKIPVASTVDASTVATIDGFEFRENGTRLYTSTVDGSVTENLLTTAWDITTAVPMNSENYVSEETVDIDFVPPQSTFDVPRNVQTFYDQNNVEVTISWDANDPNIDHYNVYRADSSGGNFTEISSSDVTNTYFVDSSVSSNQEFFYKVSAVIGGSETSLSEETSVSTANLILDEGFENDLSNWNVNNSDFQIKSDNVFAGSQSGGIELSSNTTYLYATFNLSSSRQISEAEFYYYETSDQPGSGVRFFNSNDNQELGVATNNPQWVFAPTNNEGDIIEVFDGSDDPNGGGNAVYQTWHRVNLQFDWNVPEVSWTWENTSDGITKTGTQAIQNGVDISFIELHQFKGFSGDAWATFGTPDAAMWYDDITLKA